jgi:CRP/FNR family transcriptional regulator, cyclic AMP receptor protein
MQTVEQLIAELPVFAGLAPEHLALVAGCAGTAHAAAGTELFREGAAADAFFVLRRGAVALEAHLPAGPPLVIETLHAGDVVGWSWLVPPYRWHFDGRAVEDVRMIGFDAACLRGKAEADPALGYELLKRFSALMLERLQATRLRLLDVYGAPVAP